MSTTVTITLGTISRIPRPELSKKKKMGLWGIEPATFSQVLSTHNANCWTANSISHIHHIVLENP